MMPNIRVAAQSKEAARPRRRRFSRLTGAAVVIALVAFTHFVHPFLAINAPVEANSIVIEGWVPKYVLDHAVVEIDRGRYDHIFVAGMTPGNGATADSARTMQYLAEAGIPPSRIFVVAIPETRWNRTSSMARAVRARMHELKVQPTGVNIVTLGPHGRQSLLAYSRMFGPAIPTGVITVPKNDYDPAWWWASTAGIKKTVKDFAGWVREALFGLRS